MRTQIQIVTPEIAAHFLQKNKDNRDYRKKWVAHLSNIIKTGEWLTTHQGIALDKDGNLIDGQHRLLAIIDSGLPVQINVSYDVDANTFSCIDIGVKRNLADITRFSKKTAEVCAFMARFLEGGFATIPTAAKAEEIYDNGIGKLSDELNEFCNKNIKFYSSVPFRLAAVIMVMDGHDKEYVFNTYHNLVNLHMAKLPPIAHSLIKQVHDNNINTHDKHYTVGRAFKVFDENRKVSKLLLSDNDLKNVVPYVRNVYSTYQINTGA